MSAGHAPRLRWPMCAAHAMTALAANHDTTPRHAPPATRAPHPPAPPLTPRRGSHVLPCHPSQEQSETPPLDSKRTSPLSKPTARRSYHPARPHVLVPSVSQPSRALRSDPRPPVP
eukprot:5116491-Prymnesium_polylepis.1